MSTLLRPRLRPDDQETGRAEGRPDSRSVEHRHAGRRSPDWLPGHLVDASLADAGPDEPEGLARSSCAGPAVRAARSAVAASARGVDAATWRATLARHGTPADVLAEAEQCARTSGLWPWAYVERASRESRPSGAADDDLPPPHRRQDGAPMDSMPPIADAVTTLHDGWTPRVEDLQRLARQLPDLPLPESRRALAAAIEDLEQSLGPYMEIEEAVLGSSAYLTVLSLEHGVIRRSLARARAAANADPFDPHLAQARLARLIVALLDHLRHERTTYLPLLSSRVPEVR